MLNEFSEHIKSSLLIKPDKYYLLAISGGIDSVCLAHLLKRCGYDFGLAHCNFQLRGKESEEDEAFVRSLAEFLEIKFISKRFDTLGYKKIKGGSTQMAARALRYAWFDELLNDSVCEGILVAHHANDQLETILLNLLRGSGVEGIYGMAERRQGIIRPFLPFYRSDIYKFMKEGGLEWREDPTNAQSDYKRNYIRNQVIPKLMQFQPDAPQQLLGSFGRIKDTGKAFFHFFEQWKNSAILTEENYQTLPIERVIHHPGRASLLYYWLRPFGINFTQVEEILKAVDGEAEPGKCFPGDGYVLNVDRDSLILGPEWVDKGEVEIRPTDIETNIQGVEYELIQLNGPMKIDKNPFHAMLDMDMLEYPLSVRNWQEGDRFRPFGMKQFKKISDFLIDLKVPLVKKQSIKVLCSGDAIAWVIGYRIDDRFAVSVSTKRTLYLKRK